jgi:hypothetical protein
MKESYGEGLATHTGPESCGAAREGDAEALTGTCGPGIQPRKYISPGRRRCKEKRKAASGAPIPRGAVEVNHLVGLNSHVFADDPFEAGQLRPHRVSPDGKVGEAEGPNRSRLLDASLTRVDVCHHKVAPGMTAPV